MKIDRVIVGELETNCYVLGIDDECLVIDPGAEFEKINEVIAGRKVVGVIVTHRHFDHIGALDNFSKDIIYDKSNLEEKEYTIGSFVFDVIYTPGHKEDAISIYFKKENVMFVGDFIFEKSIGRVDLPGGDLLEMTNSLKKIKEYPDCVIYPGHGNKTTLDKEKKTNPYLVIWF